MKFNSNKYITFWRIYEFTLPRIVICHEKFREENLEFFLGIVFPEIQTSALIRHRKTRSQRNPILALSIKAFHVNSFGFRINTIK